VSRCRIDYACLTYLPPSEAAEIILKIVYDYNIEPHDKDPLVGVVKEALEQFSAAAIPGKWAVDAIPMLEHLPEWLPGSSFKATARLWRQTLMDVVDVPYKFVQDRIASGEVRTSFVSKSIEQARKESTFDHEAEHAIKWSAASMYAGGADTSVSTMVAFFLAMSMFPDVQRKAQEEIDRVVGTSRLPDAGDRASLPYVNAVVEEAQRWHPIAPTGLPHVADEDDTINGVTIPKGAVLIPSIWWFTRDPATYHDPEAFKPERFLEPYKEPSATNVTFGFGRRICPGKALADASLYLTFAQSLAAFDIKKAADKDGHIVQPEHTFAAGVIAYPGDFDVQIAPRTAQSKDLIEAVLKEHPWEEGDSQYIRKAEV
jgi:cytochrome P450